MTSFSKPTQEQIDRAIALMASPQHCRVFFGKLDNPEWVAALREKGCFEHPPEPVESGGGLAHPFWPASHYLARMASAAPREVFAALDAVTTSNARVIADICDAAVSMPGDLAEALSAKVLAAINACVWIDIYADKVAGLISKLAGDGRIEPALELADVFFVLKPRKATGHEPVGIIDSYHYGQSLVTVTNAILAADAPRALTWLCGLLVKAASLHVGPEARNGFDDISCVWRPTVESQGLESDSGFTDSIITATCGVSEQVVRDGVWPLAKAVYYLEGTGKLILSRIALHVVRVFSEKDVALARQKMLDRTLFEDHRYRHEYAMLLKYRFAVLRSEEQKSILGWIDRGPDKEETQRVLKANLGDNFKEEYVDRRIKAWQRDRLSWFCDSLPPEWRERYESLVADIGPPEHADVTFWCETRWGGGEPPKTAKQLAAMDTASLVKFLQSWRPDPEDAMGPTVADLGNQFGAAARDNLERFSNEAPAFAALHPTYVTKLLSEIATALQNKRQVVFEPVIDLCLAVVAKPVASSPEDRMPGDLLDSDPTWEYARNEVATVVERMCDHNAPIQLRDRLRQCLSALENAPDRNYIVGEPEEDVRLVTWLDHACNNPKARWVHAVIRYAIWVKKQILNGSGEEEANIGMVQVPEAADLLCRVLERGSPWSPAVRSEYGQSFPALCWLDRGWAERHAAAVFTMSGEQARHGWAAWNSYLVANRAYDGVFDILEGYYSRAVDALERNLETASARFNPLASLAEHLIVLCGRGRVAVDQPSGILLRFFERAPTDTCAHAIETVGRSLRGDGDIPADIIERFVQLWEWFWTTLVEGQKHPPKEELAAFGWWLACGRFDNAWCLDQLLGVTESQPLLSPERETMERLSELAKTYPDKVIICADRMVRGEREGWRLSGWRDALPSLLKDALASDNAAARSTATRLIDHLGRRGFLEYGILVNSKEP